MTLKSIEMQIAIPRTGDAAIMQNQSQHKPIHDQALLMNSAARHAEELRQMSEKVEEASAALIRDGGEQGKKQNRRQKTSVRNSTNEQSKSGHPFKGHNIDFTL